MFAISLLQPIETAMEGRLFVLANLDLVFVYTGNRLEVFKSAVKQLRLLFANDAPLLVKQESKNPLLTWFELDQEFDAFMQLAQSLRGSVPESPSQSR